MPRGSVIRGYENFIKQIERELVAADRENLRKAAMHIKQKVRDKIKARRKSLPGEPPGRNTGALLKSLRIRSGTEYSLVGFIGQTKSDAIKPLALEFGSDKMRERPVLFPTMAEEVGAVRRILSGDWIK